MVINLPVGVRNLIAKRKKYLFRSLCTIERGSTRVCSLFLLAAALTLRTVAPHTEGVADQVRIPRPKIVQGLAPSTARSRSETFSRRRAWEFSPQASTLVPVYHGQSGTPVPTKDTLHFLKNVL